MTATASEISQLANILHENGDKVLNALSKLSLNAVLLQKLNREFETYLENTADNEESFQVVTPTHGNSQLLKDLHFLHDFIQKTVGLKLSNNSNLNLLSNKIDISKFKNVKYLELKKIPVSEIVGLKSIQPQLGSIICIRCLSNLESLLAKCGGDNSNEIVWNQLTEAVFSYNNIQVIDTSIALAPWLQVLDLSHNQITDAKAIECLPNLKYVNLSYNCLDVVPIFNKSARKKIELLVLKNNYIEDLSGISGLSHLSELDLSNNWIASWESLDSFLTISTLQWLSLAGNPISCHNYYRKRVAGYLHISASLSDFYLDKVKLSKKEKAIVGIKLYDSNDVVCIKSNIERLSNESFKDKSMAPDRNIEEMNSSVRKSGKARLVVIPNLDDGTYEETPSYTNSWDFLSSSNEYLLTKKRIENTRSTYGIDNWLVHGSSVVQDILGLPSTHVSTSTPCDDLCLKAALNSVKNVVTTVAVIETQPHTLGEDTEKNTDSFITCREGDSTSNYFSAETSTEKHEDPLSEKQQFPETTSSKEVSPDIEEIPEEEEEEENNDDIEIDENENLFVVLKESAKFNGNVIQEEMFLTITENELLERETTKGKISMKWCLSSLESCVKLKSNRLQLVFDTMRRDKKERIYILEEQEAKILHKKLAEILESRTLSDMNQVAYKCENCGSQFSAEIKSRKSGLSKSNNQFCPFCHSKFVLQLDEPPLPSSEKKISDIKNSKNSDVKISHNRSFSASGFFQSFRSQNDDKLLKSASQSSIGSAASLNEINELPSVYNSVKKSDSDIEILSNPSQSSIEVIDGPGRSFSSNALRRKKSSEEGHTSDVMATSTTATSTLKNKNNVPPGLTESSSSGSITDSICTAYESTSTVTGNKKDNDKALAKESVETEEKTEPILQEVLSHIRKRKKKTKEVDLVKYSYSDFNNIDHRIKLYLYTHVFDDVSEEFSFGLRAIVSPVNTDNFSNTRPFPACIIASSKNLYFLKVINSEQGDDARNFLQKVDSLCFNLHVIVSIFLLTWYQGFGIKIKVSKNKHKHFLILLMNSSRTKNFLKFLTSTDTLGLDNVIITKETEQKPYWSLQHLLLSSPSLDDSNIQYFSLFNSCSIYDGLNTRDIHFGGILTNSTEILIMGSNSNWMHDEASQQPKIEVFQKFKNLVQVYTNDSIVILQYFDGIKETEVWCLNMEGESSSKELLDHIRESWEKIFSIPLQLSFI